MVAHGVQPLVDRTVKFSLAADEHVAQPFDAHRCFPVEAGKFAQSLIGCLPLALAQQVNGGKTRNKRQQEIVSTNGRIGSVMEPQPSLIRDQNRRGTKTAGGSPGWTNSDVISLH
jgi:hypothetical protein